MQVSARPRPKRPCVVLGFLALLAAHAPAYADWTANAPPTKAELDGYSSIAMLEGAALHGDISAQLALAQIYENGLGVPRAIDEAVRWYKAAARQGSTFAQILLASWYDRGINVPQNLGLAETYYEAAARGGDVAAQARLASMYYNGVGVRADHQEARYWFSKAALAGNAEAQFMLGLIYADGDGVRVDYAQAFHHIQLAATSGHVPAQFMLGLLYAKGIGVAPSKVLAQIWFAVSDANGSTEKPLDDLDLQTSRVTPALIAKLARLCIDTGYRSCGRTDALGSRVAALLN